MKKSINSGTRKLVGMTITMLQNLQKKMIVMMIAILTKNTEKEKLASNHEKKPKANAYLRVSFKVLLGLLQRYLHKTTKNSNRQNGLQRRSSRSSG